MAAVEERLARKVALHVLPVLMAGYFLAFLDRVNAGFAALQMNAQVGLSPAVFGLGGGLFFVGYVLLEVPSNLILMRVGARRWLGRILITWGLVSAAMALVEGPRSFLALRFALGVAEAGFFPGVIVYLARWFPSATRARIVAAFMVAIPVSNMLGSPLSAALLGLDGWLGLAGWRWMFVLEGLPAVALGVWVALRLPEGPHEARWLSGMERAQLAARQAAEDAASHSVGHAPLWRVLTHRKVLLAALVYAGTSAASSCLTLWGPQYLHALGADPMTTGWLNAIPYAIAAPAMILWARRSDRAGERVGHTAAPLALAAIALAFAPLGRGIWATEALLCAAVVGTYAIKGPFWSLCAEWFSPQAAPAAIAQVNAIGNLGGFAATWAMGLIRQGGGTYAQGLLPLAAVTAVSTAALWQAHRPPALPE